MTTPWSQLSNGEQKLIQEGYEGLRAGMDRGIWKMFPNAWNESNWPKLQIFPDLAHVIFGLTAAIKKKYYKNKALTNHLFRGGCLVALTIYGRQRI